MLWGTKRKRMQTSQIILFILFILTLCVAITFIILYAQEKNKYDLTHVNEDINGMVTSGGKSVWTPITGKPAMCAKSFQCVALKAAAPAQA